MLLVYCNIKLYLIHCLCYKYCFVLLIRANSTLTLEDPVALNICRVASLARSRYHSLCQWVTLKKSPLSLHVYAYMSFIYCTVLYSIQSIQSLNVFHPAPVFNKICCTVLLPHHLVQIHRMIFWCFKYIIEWILRERNRRDNNLKTGIT